MHNELLLHFLATLQYRTNRALDGSPEGFGQFQAAADARSPRDLLRHMTDLIGGSAARVDGPAYHKEEAADLVRERERFDAALRDLAGALASRTLPSEGAKRLLQGPLTDAMTHTGQLSLLRRLAGSPVPAENFYVAAIDAAKLARPG